MKKKILIIIICVFIIGLILTGTFIVIKKNSTISYSISEEKWIEQNKNNSIDLYIPSEISILSSSGNGIVFDFVSFFSNDTNVKINPLAYQLGNEVSSDYSVLLVENEEKNDILLLEDEYILFSKNQQIINKLVNFYYQYANLIYKILLIRQKMKSS